MISIEAGARVIKFGCGNGNLLFELSPHIRLAWGIDKSQRLINEALAYKRQHAIENVTFSCQELRRGFHLTEGFDYSIASLFFHVIPPADAAYLLEKKNTLAPHVLICGFSHPQILKEKLLLWADQRISGHYANFKAYQEYGGMERLFEQTAYSNIEIHSTPLPFVKIYEIS